MKLSAHEIANLVQGEWVGDSQKVVTGVAPFEQATSSDIAFVAQSKYVQEIPSSSAGILLLQKGVAVSGRTAVLVENPQFAFLKILQICAQEKKQVKIGVHATAVVSSDVQIGKNVSIGAYTVIESGTTIGDGTVIGPLCSIGKDVTLGSACQLYAHVTIREEVVLQDRVILHAGCVIGADGFGYLTVNQTHHKIPQIGTVLIEDDVEIGANVTVDRATMGKTVIGRGSKIVNLVQIAHNVQVGAGCIIAAQTGVAGSSKLGVGVTLAGQVGIGDHVIVGDKTIVAAGSGVVDDLPAGSVMFGYLARPIQKEKKIQVLLGKLPALFSEFRKVKKKLQIDESEPKDD
ncbi:MAG: UDP-3-O-(3-hydroxymyristoyl)glucosamine N-acyltransferase [Elusimicrobia bacterium]|nr:UDP-3-O-(3-hydroxymyristoyl)glucosamine N-acyltransferase [Elusimicrobiota bacterium]